ncbi:cell division protein FtsQ/DivIB [Thermoflavimicrobium dichotomicum]|uniref:POTRA domain-containing protein, FtsQ-type n=1 Tax=Thermoflavimicrobium dichotomicum TaxID=46223 RepID=A0A1I3N558_9BACL|nr:FtsQ-type POTRA domain-containing protein [Thermoflavimicrobium dichotomicum]SFJ04484.1 POTRA domain-containing protein, FtsQ-type [Thermoflavimicrobium dichotomicum]
MDGRVPPLRLRLNNHSSTSPWFYLLMSLFLLTLITILFLRSPLSKLEKIEIGGNKLISDQEILKRIRFVKGISYFHFSPSEARRALETLPELKEVEIKKSFPNQVYIQVQEHPIIALWLTREQKLIPLLANGFALKKVSVTNIGAKPIVQGWDSLNPVAVLALKQFALLPKELQEEITSIQPAPYASDQVLLISKKRHYIFVRAHELLKKVKLYSSFKNHPSGKIYLLESIWFAPEKM